MFQAIAIKTRCTSACACKWEHTRKLVQELKTIKSKLV